MWFHTVKPCDLDTSTQLISLLTVPAAALTLSLLLMRRDSHTSLVCSLLTSFIASHFYRLIHRNIQRQYSNSRTNTVSSRLWSAVRMRWSGTAYSCCCWIPASCADCSESESNCSIVTTREVSACGAELAYFLGTFVPFATAPANLLLVFSRFSLARYPVVLVLWIYGVSCLGSVRDIQDLLYSVLFYVFTIPSTQAFKG